MLAVKPGWFTTVQDLGRYGAQQYGMPVSGAMDGLAHTLANRLVGNADAAATLEITLKGPELLFEHDALIAVTGADLSPLLDAMDLPLWTSVAVRAGSRLSFGTRRSGGRCYLALAGGIDVPPVLGSRATHVASRTGGLAGRALLPGDRIPTGTPAAHAGPGRVVPAELRPSYRQPARLRLLPGPQLHGCPPDFLEQLAGRSYRLASQSNRMGYRLEGHPRPIPRSDEWISEGTAMGALQIPPDGQPILLMADRQTTGGYPMPAVVIAADWPAAGQLLPGDALVFVLTSDAEARAALQVQWDAIDAALPARV